MYPSGTFGPVVSIGHIRDATSKDNIVSDVQKSGIGAKVSYKVRYKMPANGSAPSSGFLFHSMAGYTTENIIMCQHCSCPYKINFFQQPPIHAYQAKRNESKPYIASGLILGQTALHVVVGAKNSMSKAGIGESSHR